MLKLAEHQLESKQVYRFWLESEMLNNLNEMLNSRTAHRIHNNMTVYMSIFVIISIYS